GSFNVLLDKGDAKGPARTAMEQAARDMMTYFFTGVRLPNSSFWVNLRPDSPDRVIDDLLARTDMGRIMLAADVQLKKDLAAYTSPGTREGKQYWDDLYKKAEELFGNEDISIPTITRPWIVPDEIILRETPANAYVYKATLKVLLESDHLKDNAAYQFEDARLKTLNDYSTRLIKELILPKLSKDVNISKRYAPLRQVYYSLILAQWFKERFKNSLGADQKDLSGLTSAAAWSKETYFKQYQESFKNGEYNVQEAVRTPYGQTIRQYFSGGIQIGILNPVKTRNLNAAARPEVVLAIPAYKDIDPTRYIENLQRADITARDGGFDLRLFTDDIAEAAARGDIIAPQGVLRDDFSIFSKGFDWTNTRRLSGTAAYLLKALLERDDRILRTLVLGPGSGIELAGIDSIAAAQKHPVEIDTIGLTTLPPSFRLTRASREITAMLVEYIQDHSRDLSGLVEFYAEFSGVTAGNVKDIKRHEFIRSIKQSEDFRIPLSVLFELQNSGFSIYERLPEPYIDRQLIGKLADISSPGIGPSKAYGLILDNHGGFFYTVHQDGFKTAVLAVEPLLDKDGIFYAQHIPWMEGEMDDLEFDNVMVFVQAGNPTSMVIIRKDSVYMEQALIWARHFDRLSNSIYRVDKIEDLLKAAFFNGAQDIKQGASSRKGLSTVEADIHPSVGAPVSDDTREEFFAWLNNASPEKINKRIRFLDALESIVMPSLSTLSNEHLDRASETLGFLIHSGLVTSEEVYRFWDALGIENDDSNAAGYAQNTQMMKVFIAKTLVVSERAKADTRAADVLAAGLRDNNVFIQAHTAEAICAAINSGRAGKEDISGVDMSMLKEAAPLQDQKYFLTLISELRGDRESAYRIPEYMRPGLLRLARLVNNSEVSGFFYGKLAQCVRDKNDPALAQQILDKELLAFIVEKICYYQDNIEAADNKSSLILLSKLLGRLLGILARDKIGIEAGIMKRAFKMSDIAFKDSGSSFANASFIAEEFLNSLPSLGLEKPLIDPPEFVSRQVSSIPEVAASEILPVISDPEPARLGRTTIFRSREGKFIAFKALKLGEDPGRLTYESEVFDYIQSLKDKGVDLWAQYPRAYLIKGERVVRIRRDDMPEE
ncbi:MAG: hypothetical protein WCY10_05790, partial [Candidatus Omnitrophota bacterium]